MLGDLQGNEAHAAGAAHEEGLVLVDGLSIITQIGGHGDAEALRQQLPRRQALHPHVRRVNPKTQATRESVCKRVVRGEGAR